MKKTISFVVLHYKSWKDTINCVESILKLNNVSKIVIVDNFSNDTSTQIIKDKYSKNEKITIIESSENLGFARGNNLGFMYLKNAGEDFIVVANNDIIFNDDFFTEKIIDLYEQHHFGVLGPDVFVPHTEEHQNPLILKTVYNRFECLYKIFRLKIALFLSYLNLYSKVDSKRNNSNEDLINKEVVINKNKNIVLHGSCFIFSPEYIKKFDGLFNKTFMYGEEIILAYFCARENIKMLYSPIIHVIHQDSSSTKMILNNSRDRNIKKFKHSINSFKAFYKNVFKK